MKTLLQQFQNVRRVSTPLVVVRTTDAASVVVSLTGQNQGVPVIQWDAAQGFAARNKPGQQALSAITKEPLVLNAADAIFQAMKAPAQTILCVFNAHRVWQDLTTAQAIWNLRDVFKANNRTLVLLTTPEAHAPRELDSDVIVLDDPLPNNDQLAAIIATQCSNAQPALPVPQGDEMRKAVDAVKGLSAFVAEQIVALSLTRKGVNIPELWERKRQAVEQTPGATIYRGDANFNVIGGHEGLKRDLIREVKSKRPVKVVVIFDEFEKMMAGAQGDTSGVSQDAAQVVLTYMQNNAVRGSILFGHPGAGKTAVAKAMANEADCLCILADMGSMKGSLVGESEAKIRAFFNVVTSIAGEGGAFFVATCNSTAALTTEMRRRFKTGFYFVDLPDRREKDAVWAIHMQRFNLKKQARPDDTGWTGAEIETCCEKADNYGITLVEAAKSIVPVATSQPELIEQRRREAHGRMLSSSTGQTYQKPDQDEQHVDTAGAFVAPMTARQVLNMPES
jgi:hypothetical protein